MLIDSDVLAELQINMRRSQVHVRIGDVWLALAVTLYVECKTCSPRRRVNQYRVAHQLELAWVLSRCRSPQICCQQ